jgi:hypothetical protein
MPKGPKGQKRPADVIGNAVRVMEIATGQRDEESEPAAGKDKAAAEPGAQGRQSAICADDGRGTSCSREESCQQAMVASYAIVGSIFGGVALNVMSTVSACCGSPSSPIIIV